MPRCGDVMTTVVWIVLYTNRVIDKVFYNPVDANDYVLKQGPSTCRIVERWEIS